MTISANKTAGVKEGLGKNLALTLLYIAAGSLGQALPPVEFSLSLWLPSGIAVVALLRWGSTCLPGVLVGATALALLTGLPLGAAVLEAAGSVLGAWLTVCLLRKSDFSPDFQHWRDVILLLLATVVGMLTSAVASTAVLYGFDLISSDQAFANWWIYWVGDLLGVLTMSPLLLSLSAEHWKPARSRNGEFWACCLLSVLVGLVVFPLNGSLMPVQLPLAFLPMPLAVWAALRFGLWGASLSIFWFSGLAILGTAWGVGPFVLGSALQVQLIVLAFSTSLSALALLVTSVHGRILQSEAALREGVRHYQALFQTNPHPMWIYDLESLAFLAVNDAACSLYGYSAEEFRAMSLQDIFRPEDVEDLLARESSKQDSLSSSGVWCHRVRDGREISVEISSHAFTYKRRRARIVLAYDVTERVESEARLKHSESLLREAQYVAQLGSWELLPQQNQLICTNEVYNIYEMEPQEGNLQASEFVERVHPEDRELMVKVYRSLMRGAPSSNFEFRLQFPDGRIKWLYARCTSYGEPGKLATRLVGTIQDISARKQTEQQIHDLAFYDLLTGLPNRRLLTDRLHQAQATSTRTRQYGALLFIDLDHFKNLNDTRGHDVGDQFLQVVADRIKHCIRESDTAARFGGDEFVVMLEGLHEDIKVAASMVELVAEKIRDKIAQPYHLDGEEYHSSPSIGVSLFCGEEVSVDQLLKHADVAMYEAKASGRNSIRFFDPAMQAALDERAKLEAELRKAVTLRQFVPYFQAQIDNSGEVQGAEVLVRWEHPERGLVSPAEFIPLAEDTGLIVEIGDDVLQAACEQLARWQHDDGVMKNLELAVNVSARQFRQPNFVEQVTQALKSSGADPKLLKLELTESLVLDNVEDTVEKMNALKKQGIGFSMDDFGTGQSSLSYLKTLPLDQLKIDQSFVRDIVTDTNDAVIVQTIIVMARSLGLDVIAEGVETHQQLRFLQSRGCDAFQGYLFNRPLPLEEFEKAVRSPSWMEGEGEPLFATESAGPATGTRAG